MKKLTPKEKAYLSATGSIDGANSPMQYAPTGLNEKEMEELLQWMGEAFRNLDLQSVSWFTWQSICSVQSPSLREFMVVVCNEPEIEKQLTRVIKDKPYMQRFGIEYLQSAATYARNWSDLSKPEKDVKYVATLLVGAKQLMKTDVAPGDLDDVFRSIVMRPLHRLEDVAPREACFLRMCLGWGNEDEIDELFINGIRHSIDRALQSAAIRFNTMRFRSSGVSH